MRRHTAAAGTQVQMNLGRALFSNREWERIARSLQLLQREFQIVQCIFDDLSEARIAERLSLSPHTIHTHLERMYHKIGATSRVGILLRVFKRYQLLKGANGASGAKFERDEQPNPLM
jgi:DNA-binding CsgD family transcriptional regulator